MNVLLFRHGQKGLTPFDNPHLTADGFVQAEAILKAVQNKLLPEPTELWVSEKIRTAQTLQFVGRNFKLAPKIRKELDLRNDSETQKNFKDRVDSLVQEIALTSQNNSELKTIYLCTHYDWIEEAMSLIPCDTDLTTYQFAHWGPAQFASFQIENGVWKLIKKGTCV